MIMDPSWNMAAYRARTFRPRTHKPAKPVGPTIVDMVDRAGAFVNGVETTYPNVLRIKAECLLDDFACQHCGYVVCGCSVDKWCDTCDMTVGPDHDVVGCADAHRARIEMARRAALESQRVIDALKGSGEFDLPTPTKRYHIIDAYLSDAAPPDDVTPGQVIATLNRWALMHQQTDFRDMSEKFKVRCQSWLVSMEWAKNPQPDGLAMMQLLASFANKPKTPEPRPGTTADFLRRFAAERPAFQQIALNEAEQAAFRFPVNPVSTFR